MENKLKELFHFDSNPFTFKIIPQLFVGYTNEVNRIMNGMTDGSKFSLLLGPTGSGKTTLTRAVLQKFEEYNGKYRIIYLPKPPKNPTDWVVIFEKITKKGFVSSIFMRQKPLSLYELCENVNEKLGDKKCLLFVDEAHEASLESLEWLRTLVDHIDNLYILLAGLPVLEGLLKDNLETFLRRMNTRIELSNLTKSETRELIKKRIESVGGSDTHPFTQDTIEFIYNKTGGFPREILRVCNDLTTRAAEKNITTIDSDFIKESEVPEARVSLESLSELPERQKMIIDVLSNKDELTPSQIIAKMNVEEYKNKDNAVRAVNNLLRRLMRENIVERKKVGKAFKYKLSSKFQTLLVNA
ncbi:MAG: AAA family ATPase [Candidatus Aenigmatarchaeota archaeon]